MEHYSLEQLIAIRKIVDDMQENIARLHGSIEALRILYPLTSNSQDFGSFLQRASYIRYEGGSFYLHGLSMELGQEIEDRKKKGD